LCHSQYLILTFFGRAKKVNKETRPASHSQSILGSLANSLPRRQVKQARLKASKNTFAHNRLGRGMKQKATKSLKVTSQAVVLRPLLRAKNLVVKSLSFRNRYSGNLESEDNKYFQMINKNVLISMIVSLAVLAVYLFTMHPTISPYRDSGDLIVSAQTVGIAHPPGYPAYVLLCKSLSQALPFANKAYRMNAASALFGAAGIFFAGLALGLLFENRRYLILSLLLLAFSTAYWRLSQVSEMYSLNALFASLIAYLALKFEKASEGEALKYIYLLLFTLGFSTGNHQTIIFLLPGAVYLAYSAKKLPSRAYFAGALFFAAGFSVYLFLPLRSLLEPVSNWGSPDTLQAFLRVITRADYGGLRLHPEQSQFHWTLAAAAMHLWVYVKSLAAHFGLAAVFLGFMGIAATYRQKYFRFLLISLLISGPGFVILSNLPPSEKTTLPILEPHLVLPGVIFFFFIAAGAARALKFRGAVFVLPLVFVSTIALNYGSCGYRNHYFAYDYGKNLFLTAGKGAVIYNPDDPTAFISGYLQTVCGKRPDIKIAAFLKTRWGYERLKKNYPDILPGYAIGSGQELEKVILDYNRNKRQVVSELPSKYPAGYQSYPYGLVYRLSAQSEILPSALPFELYVFRNAGSGASRDFFTGQIVSYYASARSNLGLAFSSKRDFALARFNYLAALAADSFLAAANNNLGILEYISGNYSEADKWFSRVVRLEPSNASAYFNKALSLKAQKKFDEAKAHLNTAWDKFRYPDAGNELGLMYLNSGDLLKARGIFSSIIASQSGYLPAYYNMGLALSKLGEKSEAVRYFEIYFQNTRDEAEKREISLLIERLKNE